jgi:thymidine kinase
MSLYLILGPMFAGKSTELIRQFNLHKFMGRRILVVNHSWNQRYNSSSVTTHDESCIEHDHVITTECLRDIYSYPNIEQFDVILIEELQFFKDAFDVISHIVETDEKTVIASGLNGSAERIPMGDVSALTPIADTTVILNALCKRCRDGTPGIFSSRRQTRSDDTTNIDVGADDKYEALCRKHFLDEHPEQRH